LKKGFSQAVERGWWAVEITVWAVFGFSRWIEVYTNFPPPRWGRPPNIRQNTRRTRRAVWRELADPPICVAEIKVGVIFRKSPPSWPSLLPRRQAGARGEGNSLKNVRTIGTVSDLTSPEHFSRIW